MAIKFGDNLVNQNSDYPIVDATGNHLKGVIFSTGLPGTTDFPNKRANGTILVDTTNDKVYVYQNTLISNEAWSTAANWTEVALGTAESVLDDVINYSIGGNTFGTITGSGTLGAAGDSALDLIISVLVSFQAPTTSFTSGSLSNIPFDTEAQTGISRTISFSVTNSNYTVVSGSNYAIASVDLQRKTTNQADSSYATIASSSGSPAAFTSGTFANLNDTSDGTETFTFNDTLSTTEGQETDFQYRVRVTPNDGAGSATTVVQVEGASSNKGYVTTTNYSAPTLSTIVVSRQDTGLATNETDTTREHGNVASKIEFKLKCNSPQVPITQALLQRSYNNSTWSTIRTISGLSLAGTSSTYKFYDSISTTANNVTGLSNTPSGYTNVSTAIQAADTDEDRIYYRVQITDDDGNTNRDVDDITFRWPSIVGYNSTDGSGFTSTNDSTMATVLTDIRDSTGNSPSSNSFSQYEFIGTGDTGDPNFTTAGGNVSVTAPTGQFTWIAYPAGLNLLENFQVPGGSNLVNAFSFGSNLYKSLTVDFETHFGVTNTAYEVYCSNSSAAFDGTFIIS